MNVVIVHFFSGRPPETEKKLTWSMIGFESLGPDPHTWVFWSILDSFGPSFLLASKSVQHDCLALPFDMISNILHFYRSEKDTTYGGIYGGFAIWWVCFQLYSSLSRDSLSFYHCLKCSTILKHWKKKNNSQVKEQSIMLMWGNAFASRISSISHPQK